MQRLRLSHRARMVCTIGFVAATTGGAGLAFGAIPNSDGAIEGCYTKVGGILRVIDKAAGQACVTKLETPIKWNQKGAAGPRGATGPQGSAGPTGDTGPRGADGAALTSVDELDGLTCDDAQGTVDVRYTPVAGGSDIVLRCVTNPPDCGPRPGPDGPEGTWRCTDDGTWKLDCAAGYEPAPTTPATCIPATPLSLVAISLPAITLGNEGIATITLNRPVPADTTITIAISDTNVAQAPDAIVPAGTATVDVRVTGISPGRFVITASLGSQQISAEGTVVGPGG